MKWKASSRRDYGSKQKTLAGTDSVNCISTNSSSCRNRDPLMNTSVTGALWQHFHRFPLLLTQNALKAFFYKVRPLQAWLMWQKLRIWGETDELLEHHVHCRAASEPNRFPDTVRIILYFYKAILRLEVWQQVRAGTEECCTQGWNRFAIPALNCTTTDTAKWWNFHAHYLHFLDRTCLESCHQLAHTLRHCVPHLGTQMTAKLRKLPACTPGLLVDSEWLQTAQPHPREQDFLTKHPCVELLLINTSKQLLSTSLKPYACYIHKSTFPLKIFKLKLLINPLRWSRWICQFTIRKPFCQIKNLQSTFKEVAD